MAVYTDVGSDDLTGFLAAYDVGELRALKGIAEGVENSNYLVTTTGGTFILTLYERRVAEGDLPFFLALLRHLAGKGLPCPVPVVARDGVALRRLADRPACLFPFLEGLSVRRPQPLHCAALGRALAELHLGTADFSGRRPNALSLAGWHMLASETAARADTVHPGLAHLIADELVQLSARWPSGLPDGVIHADLFPDNVFFIGERLSGLIDFYFACNDLLAYDLAICLNAWCFEGPTTFNVTKARAMTAAYDAVRKLSAPEIAALPVLARGAALRFLLTRLTDWLNHDPEAFVRPKDPREYIHKLQFHRGAAGPADYGLAP